MTFKHWRLTPDFIFSQGPVIPVIVIKDLKTAVPIAKALVAGGIKVLEVTLRTPVALDAIRLISDAVPDAIVGAGTITTVSQLQHSIEAGAQFAISPGISDDLLQAGKQSDIAFIPGISTISELMSGINSGYSHFKFFPAESSGGVKALKSIYGPFPDIRFCPTGGINQSNVNDYLALPNVKCIGGSWILPDQAISEQQWQQISDLTRSALSCCIAQNTD